MTLTITHTKVDNITAWTQNDVNAQIAAGNLPAGTTINDLVLSTDWNANHSLSGDLSGYTITASQISNATITAGSSVSGSNTGDQTTISGNAGTATKLQTAHNINGVAFDGSADITVTAAAGTLTGTTLASNVTASSLTSFGASIALGTPASGVATNLTGTATALNIGGNAATVTTNANLTGDVTSVGNATTIGAGKVTEAMQVLADNTTNNVSTSKHGYAPKAPNDATKYLDGTGA
jgi:hypothetical protein